MAEEKLQLELISEKGLEQCLKCSICTAYCPVLGVTDDYPGPKQCGPDGERYRLKDARYFDEKTLKMCLNCKRCEVACPHGVHVADIIQSARIKYSNHGPSLRDFTLANTDLVGSMTTMMAPLVNWGVGLAPAKYVMDAVLGIDKHRTFPKYASTKFTTWFRREAEAGQKAFQKQVSFFHGCYVNYNYPQLGKDFVSVMNALGYGVQLLDKEKCCGVALVANGQSKQARRQGEVNIESIRKAKQEGRDTLTVGSTCTLMMRDEYPALLGIENGDVRNSINLVTRFICRLVEEEKVKLVFKKDFKLRVAYHTACHMERLGWAVYSQELLRMIPGLKLIVLPSQCCGISGTYGFKKENYKVSMAIGEKIFAKMIVAKPDCVATECETCKWQIEMGTGMKVENPISILAQALDLEATRKVNAK